jgi:hypothetical protein
LDQVVVVPIFGNEVSSKKLQRLLCDPKPNLSIIDDTMHQKNFVMIYFTIIISNENAYCDGE